MATIIQQAQANMVLVNQIANEAQKMQSIVARFQTASVALDPDNAADTTVTLSAAQKQGMLDAFNTHLTNIKTASASLQVVA